jgi:hypothetical protein
MHIPQGMTEKEVLACISVVAGRLAKKYKFGYFTEEDIMQEAIIEMIRFKTMEKYQPGRPLENYLAVALHNLLFNFKRNNYTKPNTPCIRCPLKAFLPPNGCSLYENRSECKFYKKWETTNASKHNLMYMLPVDVVFESANKTFNLDDNIDNFAVHSKNLERLNGTMRKHYLMLLDGMDIYKKNFNELVEFLKNE